VNNKTFDFEDVRMNFFHDEMQWLQGKNIPSFGMKTCNSYEGMKSGKMYVTKLGNQVNLNTFCTYKVKFQCSSANCLEFRFT